MTQNCYVVANNICEINIDVSEEYDIVITSIQGIYRTPILKTEDYVIYESNTGTQKYTATRDIYESLTTDTILAMFSTLLEQDKNTNLIKYKYDITYCTNRFKYLLGISKFPVRKGEYTQSMPFGNGPPFLNVDCDKLAGCGVINANMFTVNSVFSLQGPGYTGSDLTNLVFKIKGLYNEDVIIEDELLWSFTLCKHSTNQNSTFRFSNQYR